MPTAPKTTKRPRDTGVDERLLGIETRIADLDPRAALLEIKAQLAQITAGMLEIKQMFPAVIARAPIPLSADEVAEIVKAEPAAIFIALSPVRQKGIKPGDRFEQRSTFKDEREFISRVRGGSLKVARAA